VNRAPLIYSALKSYKKLLHAFGGEKGAFNIFNQGFLSAHESASLTSVLELKHLEEVMSEIDTLQIPALFFIKIKEDPEPYISALYSALSQKIMRVHYFLFEINTDVTVALIQRVQKYYRQVSPTPRIFNPHSRILTAYADI